MTALVRCDLQLTQLSHCAAKDTMQQHLDPHHGVQAAPLASSRTSHHPKKRPVPMSGQSPSLSQGLLTYPLPVPVEVPVLDVSHTWGHTLGGPVCPASLTQHPAFRRSHTAAWISQESLPPSPGFPGAYGKHQDSHLVPPPASAPEPWEGGCIRCQVAFWHLLRGSPPWRKLSPAQPGVSGAPGAARAGSHGARRWGSVWKELETRSGRLPRQQPPEPGTATASEGRGARGQRAPIGSPRAPCPPSGSRKLVQLHAEPQRAVSNCGASLRTPLSVAGVCCAPASASSSYGKRPGPSVLRLALR